MQWRLLTLACLLGAEILLSTIWFDGASLPATGGLVSLLAQWAPWVLRWAVGFAAIFATFAYLRHQPALGALATAAPIRPLPLALHFALFAVFLALSLALYSGGATYDLAVMTWGMVALGVGASAALALIPRTVWLAVRRITGNLWVSSAAAAALACAISPLSRGLWAPASRSTFWLVKQILSLLLRDLVLQPERLRLGTKRFMVIISEECSGLEGLALLLIFGILWLVLFRDELRFPRALLLLPAAMAVLYLSNALRIAALVLIGNAGWPDIAARGFHSQAGWIAFNLVAFGLSLGARRLRWFSNRPLKVAAQQEEEHPAAPFLIPLLAILAAGMISGALSAGFEWFYFFRVAACAGALWFFRKDYAGVDWRCTWLGPILGVVVFVIWMYPDAPAKPMPAALAAASPPLMLAWLVFRIIGGVLTVPIAEELAFRAFGLRRLISADFEAVPWRAFSWTALLISSALFGAMHGERWLAGTVAGVLYALAMRWRGRLGDAIVAHAVTNGLLAYWVLQFQNWQLW